MAKFRAANRCHHWTVATRKSVPATCFSGMRQSQGQQVIQIWTSKSRLSHHTGFCATGIGWHWKGCCRSETGSDLNTTVMAWPAVLRWTRPCAQGAGYWTHLMWQLAVGSSSCSSDSFTQAAQECLVQGVSKQADRFSRQTGAQHQ